MTMQNVKFDAVALAARMQQAASEDGLEIVAPGVTPPAPGGLKTVVTLTDRLTQWLLDLRLLRHVPLAYLVPDPQLLPTESIRFFHLDATWTDRLVDGALSAGDLGTLDMTFTVSTMKKLRQTLDGLLGLDASGTISGMLIRSQLVARWPDLIVRAYKTDGATPSSPLPILRKDVLSQSIMIVLFAGVPQLVQIREPHVGLRFGVEGGEGPNNTTDPSKFQVPNRDNTGAPTSGETHVDVSARRVIDLAKLAAPIPSGQTGSRDLAVKLIRPPFVQNYRQSSKNPGSMPPPSTGFIRMVGGKTVLLKNFVGR